MSTAGRILRACLELLLPQSARERALNACTPEILLDRLAVHEYGGVLVLFSYRDPLIKVLVQSLKYHGSDRAAALCAAALGDVLAEDIAEHKLLSPTPAVLVPIPLSPERRRDRGYNQMELVIEKLVEHMDDVEYLPHTLQRVRNTKPQTRLPRHERLTNVAGAFSVPDPRAVSGRTVYLFDDVVTTGTTLREAAAELARSGATVRPVAIAH